MSCSFASWACAPTAPAASWVHLCGQLLRSPYPSRCKFAAALSLVRWVRWMRCAVSWSRQPTGVRPLPRDAPRRSLSGRRVGVGDTRASLSPLLAHPASGGRGKRGGRPAYASRLRRGQRNQLGGAREPSSGRGGRAAVCGAIPPFEYEWGYSPKKWPTTQCMSDGKLDINCEPRCALKESFIWVERKTYYKRM